MTDFAISIGLPLLAFAGSLIAFPWRKAGARRKCLWAVLLLIPPLAALAWGQFFAVDPRYHPGPPSPTWALAFLDLTFWAALVSPLLLVAMMKGARPFFALFGAGCFMATAWNVFIASMQVTGTWA